MYYYCDQCGVVDEDNVEQKLISKAIYYPNDLAHPAEYDDPTCSSCGNYVCEYVCDNCLVKGNEDDEILLVNKTKMFTMITCHKCLTKKRVEKVLSDFVEETINNLIHNFSFADEQETYEYAEELINEILKGEQLCANTAKTS